MISPSSVGSMTIESFTFFAVGGCGAAFGVGFRLGFGLKGISNNYSAGEFLN